MLRILDVRQRVWKCSRTCPRHGEHEMHGNTQDLSTVDMGEADGVRNDRLCDERRVRSGIRLDA